MGTEDSTASARHRELLQLAYDYVLEHGLADLSLRPLAGEIGSSPRVLLFLFGSKDGLVRALLRRARADELALLDRVRAEGTNADLPALARRVWSWLAAPEHRALLALWVEGYGRSLTSSDGPWEGFARATVADWLQVLAEGQPSAERGTSTGRSRRTLVLAILRGALLDLLATGEDERVTAAVHLQLDALP